MLSHLMKVFFINIDLWILVLINELYYVTLIIYFGD